MNEKMIQSNNRLMRIAAENQSRMSKHKETTEKEFMISVHRLRFGLFQANHGFRIMDKGISIIWNRKLLQNSREKINPECFFPSRGISN